VTGILNPIAILALPLIGFLLVIVALQHKKREERRQRLGVASTISTARIIIVSLIPCALMALALLRPYSGSTDVTLPSSTSDYMFVVDVSRSMFTKDVTPSRIELAKRKLKDLIDEFTLRGDPHRYGITLFAGYSYLLCPVTDDTSVVKQFISEISPSMVTSLGSNLEAGITTALSRFNETNSQNVRILLVSDGEDDLLSLERVITLIRAKKIRVDVLGVGTVSGMPIELDDGTFVRDRTGSVVNSKLGDDSLRAIAEAGRGTYVPATLDDRDVRELAQASLALTQKGNQGTRTIRTYQEFGSWIALGALLVLLAIACLPQAGAFVRVVVCILLLTEGAAAAPLTSSAARTAYELYGSGDYKGSVDAFKAAIAEDPNNRDLQQGYASALFKTGNFPEAQKLFNALASQSAKGKEYFDNTYNEGTSLLAMKRYQQALDAFTKALDVKPDDERALHNQGVARALLEQEKNKPTPTPTPTQDPNQSPQPSPSPDASPSAQPSPQSSPEQSDSNEKQQNQGTPPPDNQQGSPSPQPSAESSPQPQSSPQPDAATPSPPPAASPETPQNGSPSPEAQGTPSPEPQTPEDDRLKENQEENAPPPEQQSAQRQSDLDTRSPSQKEAEAWLESLPESPLLIRRERGRGAPGGQTW
jgi:Ca-activated chloride channel family protein